MTNEMKKTGVLKSEEAKSNILSNVKIFASLLLLALLAAGTKGAMGQIQGLTGLDDSDISPAAQVTAACTEQYGVTYATAACIVGSLSAEELQKCFDDGVGGEGCFGDNNTLVGWIQDIQQNGVLGGDHSVVRDVCNTVAGIFGGSCDDDDDDN